MSRIYQSFQSGLWRGVCREGFTFPAADLDAWLEELQATAGRQRKSRWIAMPSADAPWFVKVLTAASDHDTLPNRLKWRFRPSRMLHNWRISQEMQAAGFGVPEILLAARKRTWRPWGWPTDVLVMAPVEGRQLQEALCGGNVQALLATVAAELARFHAAGFAHGDCIPGNLFLSQQGLAFIDNDRTMRSHAWDCAARRRRNLVQFGFHLLQKNLATREQLLAFLAQYFRCAQWPEAESAREIARSLRWIDKRLAIGR